LLSFDFIADDRFRESLQSDYAELRSCDAAQAWKAVHVLAGSIIEALLVEYLVVSSTGGSTKDPHDLGLNDLIKACKGASVLSETTASMSEVVKDYRNLVHPGRMIRMRQTIDRNTAQVALNLVEIITREVAKKRKESYGLTAEQIAKKLRVDEHARFLIPHLLKEANSFEKKRLVESVIPAAYLTELDDFPVSSAALASLSACYRQVFEELEERYRRKATERFAGMVKEESAATIRQFGDAFFICKDLALLPPNDASLVKNYILSRIDELRSITDPPTSFLDSLRGLSRHLEARELHRFISLLVRPIVSEKVGSDSIYGQLLKHEFDDLEDDKEKQEAYSDYLEAWEKHAEEKAFPEKGIEALKEITSYCIFLPF
jgi:hypothetical protein